MWDNSLRSEEINTVLIFVKQNRVKVTNYAPLSDATPSFNFSKDSDLWYHRPLLWPFGDENGNNFFSHGILIQMFFERTLHKISLLKGKATCQRLPLRVLSWAKSDDTITKVKYVHRNFWLQLGDVVFHLGSWFSCDAFLCVFHTNICSVWCCCWLNYRLLPSPFGKL